MKRYRNDIILILAILMVALIATILINRNSTDENLKIYVYSQNKIVYEEVLDNIKEDKLIEIKGSESIVKILVTSDGVKIVESGCTNHVCINQGLIDKAGQTISCLPNEVYVVLRSEEGVDAIVWN